MAANRVADLTIEELRVLLREEMRALIRETVHEVLEEMAEDEDSDDGLEFKPEIAEYLRQAIHEKRRGKPLEDVARELGLNLDD